MKFFRLDQDGIDDAGVIVDGALEAIPGDEPCFVLRASEIGSADAVRAWASAARALGIDQEVTGRAVAWAAIMDAWATSIAAPPIVDMLRDLGDVDFLSSMGLTIIEDEPIGAATEGARRIVRADSQSATIAVNVDARAALVDVDGADSVLEALSAAGFSITRQQ